jgi:hypothetical protein
VLLDRDSAGVLCRVGFEESKAGPSGD